jgi:uncharacterized membrane protein HdeD (DUF308 family)
LRDPAGRQRRGAGFDAQRQQFPSHRAAGRIPREICVGSDSSFLSIFLEDDGAAGGEGACPFARTYSGRETKVRYWILWLIVGVLSIVAGIFAFANPFAATLTAELLAGYLFIAIGVLTLISAFQDQGWGARIWALLLGALFAIFGFSLVTNPLEGIVQLTLIVAVLLMVIGILRIFIAFTPMAAGARGLLILAGLVSIVLSVMIFTNFPLSAAVVLGIFLAIELISNGISMIFLALDRREADA